MVTLFMEYKREQEASSEMTGLHYQQDSMTGRACPLFSKYLSSMASLPFPCIRFQGSYEAGLVEKEAVFPGCNGVGEAGVT